MNLLGPVKDIMTSNLVTVGPDETMQKVERIFKTNDFHHIPVVEDDKLVGLISKSDFLFFKRGFNDHSTDKRIDLFRLKVWKVSDVMVTKLAKMDPDQRINVALDIFEKNWFHAIPIVDGEKLVGIVTTLDIIRHLAKDNAVTNEYKR